MNKDSMSPPADPSAAPTVSSHTVTGALPPGAAAGGPPPNVDLSGLAVMIAAALRESSGARDGYTERELDRIRDYALLRADLGGPVDADADPEGPARIVRIDPDTALPGDSVDIELENAGPVVGVGFLDASGGAVPATAKPKSKWGFRRTVTVEVPAEAVTGRLSVRTALATLTSRQDLIVGRAHPPLDAVHLLAGSTRGY